jgi:hypothetical protein
METKTGYATYKRGKLHFDEIGWAMIKMAAKKSHKTPTQIVRSALLRYARKHEKTKNA